MDQQQCNNATLSAFLYLNFFVFVFDWSDLMKNGRWRLGHQLCPPSVNWGQIWQRDPSGGKNLRRWRRSIKTITYQCPARVDIGSSRSDKWNENLLHSFRKVKRKSDSLFSRMKSEMKMPWYRDREWKVKWKCLKIESEKWIENASRLRSRSEVSREFSRISFH